MSIARHHAEWLSLVEANGPFLSLQVLLDAFPQGLDAHDSDHYQLLKQVYQEWQTDQGDRAIHLAWIKWVLQETLEYSPQILLTDQAIPPGYQLRIAEHQELLTPDFIVVSPHNPQVAHLLIQVLPPTQGLEKSSANSRWKASPASKMVELLHGCNVRLGLLTNGEQWMLVNAPKGETTGFISWYSHLWTEEKLTLRSFRSLLGIRRLFAANSDDSLASLLAQSKNSQQEVTDQLGFQVRKAVEVLVQKLDQIDQDHQRQLLQQISDDDLYQAALFVMMRLVFLFSAEEKGLLLLGDRIYDQNYAVSTLRAELREMADHYGEEVLERRYDAWCRLLATFRAVYYGINHDLLHLPAYGGDLFNPQKFPFLEGISDRAKGKTKPLPIDNRTVLHLLEALQILQVKVPGGGSEPRRLSFRALDVEQIGHVYEGLLDHTAVRAESTVLGLIGTKNKEPEVLLTELENFAQQGEESLIDFLKKQTGRSPATLKKLILNSPLPVESGVRVDLPELTAYQESRYRLACYHHEELWQRIKPFYQLIRFDTFGNPVIIPTGSVYVTQGSDRRETGTHYTPKSLTEEIVKYTLQPLVYEGVTTGQPQEQWQLKPAKELLKLKICDPTMGSGAFLVQICRYLGQKLLEAWNLAENSASHPKGGKKYLIITPEGELSQARPEECLIPEDENERLLVAKRIVAERCIYGVDKNPLAVEMAKLSLWLETLQKDRPFTFLDHALKCGDSLIGVNLEQLKVWNLDINGEAQQLGITSVDLEQMIRETIELRLKIENKPVNTPQDQQNKSYLLTQANARIKDLKDRADLLVSSYLIAGKKQEQQDLRAHLAMVSQSRASISDYQRAILPDLNKLRPFHWDLEFPEVFLPSSTMERGSKSGFDAIAGNPPFMGGQKITGSLGVPYREYLVEFLGKNQRGSADFCAYFFLRSRDLIKLNGHSGLVATNTIAQGDTREVGLDQIVNPSVGEGGGNGCIIYRAISSRKWEGTAALEVAYIWFKKGQWSGDFILDEQTVTGITSYLTNVSKVVGQPYRLVANQNKSFQGSIVLGNGFVLTPEEAQSLIEKNPKNQEVLFPYLNGQDLNSNPDQAPSRWVINFFNWPLSADHDDKKKGPPYASDYPDCLEIIERLVKPERDKNNRKERREKWWQYAEKCPALYETIKECDRVLVFTQISKTKYPTFLPKGIVYDQRVVVIAFDKYFMFAILCSNLHYWWVLVQGSSLKKDAIYTPSDCFETFPFPDIEKGSEIEKKLEEMGEKYYHHRQTIMLKNQQGLTKTYNRFHDPDERDLDLIKLRELHREMDYLVARAYCWLDLTISELEGLNHDFYETKQGLRYTICENARREILDRLLQLNHQRYEEEQKQGLGGKTKKKGGTKKKKTTSDEQLDLGW